MLCNFCLHITPHIPCLHCNFSPSVHAYSPLRSLSPLCVLIFTKAWLLASYLTTRMLSNSISRHPNAPTETTTTTLLHRADHCSYSEPPNYHNTSPPTPPSPRRPAVIRSHVCSPLPLDAWGQATNPTCTSPNALTDLTSAQADMSFSSVSHIDSFLAWFLVCGFRAQTSTTVSFYRTIDEVLSSHPMSKIV